ncbi:hypothetical protein PR003_g19033 [Phytophthora rubi]|uniref:Uncharacterized protein n=1 Tax=Phytophthora rubi TaxID=129364 RepID=A0A6A4DZT2_9STRA|nr:hypothetical protein PF003_g11172 [Phytophthora fragariae]KAE9315276.1 hypothetical protein PR003_g19033 [Phytophthora rubi]
MDRAWHTNGVAAQVVLSSYSPEATVVPALEST